MPSNPVYSSNALVATRRQKDFLEISVQATPGDAVVSWLRVPLLSELSAYTPATQDAEMPLYVDSGGAVTTLKASTPNGGTISFATAADASNAVYVALLKAANSGQQCVYRAHFESQTLLAQGQCTIKDKGSQGSANDIPTWGFEIAGFNVSYYNSNTGTLIV